jgi:Thermophilic metalloprotease (M29)
VRDRGVADARLSRYAALFDAADEVRLVGEGADLRLSLAGRRMEVDAGMGNMPGGELFGCPVEDSAEGTITFDEFPQVRDGREIRGIRLRFSGGSVVDASADAEEDFLTRVLDTREDRRHRTHRSRLRIPRPRRHERVGCPLGHRQRPPQRRTHRARRPSRSRERHLARLSGA